MYRDCPDQNAQKHYFLSLHIILMLPGENHIFLHANRKTQAQLVHSLTRIVRRSDHSPTTVLSEEQDILASENLRQHQKNGEKKKKETNKQWHHDIGIHDTSTHCPSVYQVSLYTSQLLSVTKKIIRRGYRMTEGQTDRMREGWREGWNHRRTVQIKHSPPF